MINIPRTSYNFLKNFLSEIVTTTKYSCYFKSFLRLKSKELLYLTKRVKDQVMKCKDNMPMDVYFM